MNAKRRAALHVLAHRLKSLKAQLDDCSADLSALCDEEKAAYENTLGHLYGKKEGRYMAWGYLRTAWGGVSEATQDTFRAIESIEDAASMEL